MKDEFVPVVSALIRKDGKVLIARRKRANMGYVWEFPGGKPEEDEGLQDGLERILREVLGVDVSVGDYVCATGHVIHCELSIRSYVYEGEISSGDICLKDHEEVRWVYPDDLEKYDFTDQHRHAALVLMGKA